jgi:hypothetical protein
LPVLVGEESDHITIRVYNNYVGNMGAPEIYNVQFQTFDDLTFMSQSTQPVTQCWLHMRQTGFGENASRYTPALYTAYSEKTDTAVGGSSSAYIPSWGSDGSSTAIIRAGTTSDRSGFGTGMLEFDTYISIPVGASVNNTEYSFVNGIIYDWNN